MTNENKNFGNFELTKKQVEKIVGKRKECILELGEPCTLCGACLYCDIDPDKICDNCGKCLDTYNTDDKGYVSIKIDKIIQKDPTLEELYKEYGLDDDEENNN